MLDRRHQSAMTGMSTVGSLGDVPHNRCRNAGGSQAFDRGFRRQITRPGFDFGAQRIAIDAALAV
jgi:hypothetical protein